jgi:hypothetical protein
LQDAVGNDFRGGLDSRFLHRPVQVVHVEVELLRKTGGTAQVICGWFSPMGQSRGLDFSPCLRYAHG